LEDDLLTVDERQRAKAIVLRLVHPALTLRKLRLSTRELWLDRRLQRQ
jgi:hypothetical protein